MSSFIARWKQARAIEAATSRSSSAVDQVAAIERLGALPLTDESLQVLRALALGEDFLARMRALDALGRQNDVRAVRALLEIFAAGVDEAFWKLTSDVAGMRQIEAEVVHEVRRIAVANLEWEHRVARCRAILEAIDRSSAYAALRDIAEADLRRRVASIPTLLREALTSKWYNDVQSAIEALGKIDAPEARAALDEFHRQPSRKVTREFVVVVAEHESSGAEVTESRYVDWDTSDLGQRPGADEVAKDAAATAALEAKKEEQRRALVASAPFAHGDILDIQAAVTRCLRNPACEAALVLQLCDKLLGGGDERREGARRALRGADGRALATFVRGQLVDRGPEQIAQLMKEIAPEEDLPDLAGAYLAGLRVRVADAWRRKEMPAAAAQLLDVDREVFWQLLVQELSSGAEPWPPLIPFLDRFDARGIALAASLLPQSSWSARRQIIRMLGQSAIADAHRALAAYVEHESDYELQREIRAILAKGGS